MECPQFVTRNRPDTTTVMRGVVVVLTVMVVVVVVLSTSTSMAIKTRVFTLSSGLKLKVNTNDRAVSGSRMPVALWFHGIRDKDEWIPCIPRDVSDPREGVVTVSVRLPSDRNPFAHIADVSSAIHWIINNALSLKADPNRIHVGGHGDSAHAAMTVVLNAGGDLTNVVKSIHVCSMSTTNLYDHSDPVQVYTLINETRVQIDRTKPSKFAISPLYRIIKTCVDDCTMPVVVMVTSDRLAEIENRYEQSLSLRAHIEYYHNIRVPVYEIQGYGHGSASEPCARIMLDHVLKRMFQ